MIKWLILTINYQTTIKEEFSIEIDQVCLRLHSNVLYNNIWDKKSKNTIPSVENCKFTMCVPLKASADENNYIWSRKW